MTALDEAFDPRTAFSYLVWSIGLYVSTIAAAVAAAIAPAVIHGGMDNAANLLGSLLIGMAVFTLGAWPPGLLSIFLFALTDLRPRHHALVGAAVFATLGGLLGGFSAAGAVYGAVFGLVSVGGAAGTIALYRSIRTQFSKRPFHG